jgi:predicted transcriptional regulator
MFLLDVIRQFMLHCATKYAKIIRVEKGVSMNTLHVRSVPDDLYARLQQLARARNRSLSAQVVEMLSQSMEEEELRLKQGPVLASIRRRRFSPPEESLASLDLLREDRKR